MITNATHRGFQGGKQAWMLGAGALAAMAVCSAGAASAAPITWGTPTTIAGPTDVSTQGTSVIAWDPGISGSGNYNLSASSYGAINPVINGVTFSGGLPSGSSISYNGTVPSGSPSPNLHMYADTGYFSGFFSSSYVPLTFGSASTDAYPILTYQLPGANPTNKGTPAYNYALALTDFAAYVNGSPPAGALAGDTMTLSLGNLTPGHLYQMQIWLANTWGMDQTLSDSAANLPLLTPGNPVASGSYLTFKAIGHSASAGYSSGGGYMGADVLGTFVAGSSGVQTVVSEAGYYVPAQLVNGVNVPAHMAGTNHNIIMNMFQLRDLGVAPTTPEPTTLGLLATAGAGLLLLGRRRKPAGAGSFQSGAGG